MTTADASLTPTPAQKPARTCKWLVPAGEAREMLARGMAVPCKTTDRQGRTTRHTFYWVGRDIVRPNCWLVQRETEDGAQPLLYHVDGSFGPDPARHWSCDHNSVNGFTCRESVGCRHCLMVAALLKAIDVA